nr:MAG TPA: hypothetical protein [Caudoviricetes sp.]
MIQKNGDLKLQFLLINLMTRTGKTMEIMVMIR